MMVAILISLLLTILSGLCIYKTLETPEQQQIRVATILSALPHTQCGKCNYSGCRPYAEAIALGKADINQCPPGGETTIKTLTELLGIHIKENYIQHSPKHITENELSIAVIDEALCIGCVKCIKACPVDAIFGAAKQMHCVLSEECTGCELCIAPCPMDCISMQVIKASD